jgi:hypothetical protein
MQMIPPIKLGIQLRRRTLTAHRGRKINHMIKIPLRHNPPINSLPRSLALRIRITLSTSAKRGNRAADGNEACFLRVSGDGREGFDELVSNGGLGGGGGGLGTNVVDAFEDHEVFNSRLGERVALVAGHEGGTETAAENRVAAGCLVEDCDVGVI